MPEEEFLRSVAQGGGGSSPSGLCSEHLLPCLLTTKGQHAVYRAGLRVGAGEVPQGHDGSLGQAGRAGTLMGLKQSESKTRAITMGDALKKCVGRTLVRVHKASIRLAVSEHQFGVAVEGGSEAVVHAVRATLLGPLRGTHCLLPLDSKGAFDNVLRQAMVDFAWDTAEGALYPIANESPGHGPTVVFLYQDADHYEEEPPPRGAAGGSRGRSSRRLAARRGALGPSLAPKGANRVLPRCQPCTAGR